MTQAQNYVILFESGSKEQARSLAENMSISTEQNWHEESTIFNFEDGSCIFTHDFEFKVA